MSFPQRNDDHSQRSHMHANVRDKCLEASKNLMEAYPQAKYFAHPELLQKIGYDWGLVEMLRASLSIPGNDIRLDTLNMALSSLEASKAPSLWRLLRERKKATLGLPQDVFISSPAFSTDSNSSTSLALHDPHVWTVPDGWIVCSLSLDPDRQDLFWSRLRGPQSSQAQHASQEVEGIGTTKLDGNVLLRLPLRRQALRGHGNDQEKEGLEFTYDAAREELWQILEESGETTSGMAPSAPGMEGSMGRGGSSSSGRSREERVQWWEKRRALDERLRLLLDRMESLWLGGFKGLLTTPSLSVHQKMDHIEQRILTALQKAVQSRIGRSRRCRGTTRSGGAELQEFQGIRLSPLLLSSLVASVDELGKSGMDDILYYLFDALAFQGISIAYDELDLDEVRLDEEEVGIFPERMECTPVHLLLPPPSMVLTTPFFSFLAWPRDQGYLEVRKKSRS